MCSRFSKSPRKFFDNRLALNFTSSSCVDLNLEKAVGICEALQRNFIPWVFQNFPLQSLHFVAFPDAAVTIPTRCIPIREVEEEKFVENHSERPYVRL
jgi:hypothetical protein